MATDHTAAAMDLLRRLRAEVQDWKDVMCGEREGLDPLCDEVDRFLLGKEYEAEVGYDPFEDDPTQTVAEIRELLDGVRAEAAAAAEAYRLDPDNNHS